MGSNINCMKDLLQFIEKNTNSSNSVKFPALQNAIPLFQKSTGVNFFVDTLPKIHNLAAKLVLRDFYCKIGNGPEFKLTRLEIAAYIANCFLCTISTLKTSLNGFASSHSIVNEFETKFENWFTSKKIESVHKIVCILQYLHFTSNCFHHVPATLDEVVHYKKDRVTPLGGAIENPHKSLSLLQIPTSTDDTAKVMKAEILEKRTAKLIFVDNYSVGENLFSESCFQEEIEMLVRPELILSALLGIKDKEAVTVVGAKKFSCHSGFGETFEFRGSANPHQELSPVLVLVHFRVVSGSGKLRQYTQKAIDSYISSAFSAMLKLREVDNITFEFWGWSDDKVPLNYEAERAMVADPALVLLTMWIAASMAFKDVIFRQNVNVELGISVATLCSNIRGKTIDEAYQLLLKYCSIMLINPDPMTNQNNAIFDAFKMARPGFLKIAINKSDSVYKWVEKKMHENIAQHQNTKTIQSYTIFNVFKIYNYRLWERYCEREWEVKRDLGRDFLHKHELKRLFHGTPVADLIAKNGFDKSFCKIEDAMLGKGIYFAGLSSKSVQYSYEGGFRNGCKLHRNYNCSYCPRSMLVCRVLLGKIYETPPDVMKGKTSPPTGFHSVEANLRTFNLNNSRPLQYPENVVYNNFQAYPGYLVKFTVNT